MTITDIPGFAFASSEERPEEPDTIPTFGDVEYPCKECGREAGPYGGRGPKPKYCEDHKKSRSPSTRKGPGTKGSNATLAEQATEALWQVNGLVAMLAMISGFPLTGAAIQERESAFREMCYNALLTDPNTCRFILRGGMQSSKVSLVVCYGMFAAGIVPTLMTEMRQRKAEKLAMQDQWEDTQVN